MRKYNVSPNGMGFVKSKSQLGNTWEHPDLIGIYGGSGMKFTYSKSWSSLMPVIQKISLFVYEEQVEDNGLDVRIIKDRAYPRTFGMISIEGKHLFRFNRMPLHESDKLIDAAYSPCVEFIEWANENKK